MKSGQRNIKGWSIYYFKNLVLILWYSFIEQYQYEGDTSQITTLRDFINYWITQVGKPIVPGSQHISKTTVTSYISWIISGLTYYDLPVPLPKERDSLVAVCILSSLI